MVLARIAYSHSGRAEVQAVSSAIATVATVLFGLANQLPVAHFPLQRTFCNVPCVTDAMALLRGNYRTRLHIVAPVCDAVKGGHNLPQNCGCTCTLSAKGTSTPRLIMN